MTQWLDLVAGAVGVGLVAAGVGLLWVWPAALIVLGVAFIALALVV